MAKTTTASRTQNTIYNFISSIGGQLLTIVMQFAVRTVFIHTLGKSYLGISGLFSNILSMLSLAELGVGSAILYKLYDPIEQKDEKRIAMLMGFYKTAYRVIGLAVAVIGVCLIPFLPMLIKDADQLDALHLKLPLIFCLYLLNSVSSYLFFAYKSAIIKANQKEYCITMVGYVTTIVGGIVQIVLLKQFCNFTVYLFVQIAQNIILNVICGRMADRMYPYINAKPVPKLPFSEIKEVFKDCGALFLYKINAVVMKATDNLVLSAFMGLDMVALYSNYYIFYTIISNLLNRLFNAVSHSIGSLHASKSDAHEYEVFEIVMLIAGILGGTAFVGIFCCSNELIGQWIGGSWVIEQPFPFLMGMELFTLAVRAALAKYRSAMGLFRQSKYRPVVGMLINLVVSLIGVKVWGICGVLVGTLAADWITFMWLDPLIVHKYGFEGKYSLKRYFFKFARNFAVALGVGFLDYWICQRVFVGFGWLSIAAHTVICAVTVPIALCMATWRSAESAQLRKLIVTYAERIMRRKGRR